MLSLKLWIGVGISVFLATAGAAIAACTNTAPNFTPGSSPPASWNAGCTDGLVISFNPMYSAFDGKHNFDLPAVAVTNADVLWTTSDQSMVGIMVDQDLSNGITIHMLKAGDVTIRARSNDAMCGSAQLHITAAKESDWEIGNARYNNGASLHAAMSTSGGMSVFETDGGGPACTACHGMQAHNIFQDVAHTPQQTGGFSDDDMLNIVLNGQVRDGGYFDPSIISYPNWQIFHQWKDITPDQQPGIVVYLRSLTPEAQNGTIDLNGMATPTGTPADDGGSPATD
jgi:hypothetical protein